MDEKKREYSDPVVEVIDLNSADVITSSPEFEDDPTSTEIA